MLKALTARNRNKGTMLEIQFGSCCKDLNDAMNSPRSSLFRVEDNGVLYLTIGYANTPEGVGVV